MRLSSFTDDPLDRIRESTNVRRELQKTTTMKSPSGLFA